MLPGSTFYSYRATVRQWIDGDTVEVDLDLGFSIHRIDRVRVYGVNCPEMRSGLDRERGRAAKAFSESLAPVGSTVVARTLKDSDKYGRFLAEIVLNDGRLVAQEIIAGEHGRPYFGGAR